MFPPRFHWVSNIFSTCIDQETKHPRGRRINLGIILAQINLFRDQHFFWKISSKSFGLSIHSSHLLFKDYSLEDIVHCVFSRNLQIWKKNIKTAFKRYLWNIPPVKHRLGKACSNCRSSVSVGNSLETLVSESAEKPGAPVVGTAEFHHPENQRLSPWKIHGWFRCTYFLLKYII